MIEIFLYPHISPHSRFCKVLKLHPGHCAGFHHLQLEKSLATETKTDSGVSFGALLETLIKDCKFEDQEFFF